MSKKQLGAAPVDETSPEAGKRTGWFGRLRGQPGFRAAAVAFVLTVVLGIGSTVAYAYWGQRNTVTQSVTTVRAPLPAVTGTTQCRRPPFGAVYIDFTPVPAASLPADAHVVVSVHIPSRGTSRQYAVANTGTFALVDLPGLKDFIGTSFWGTEIAISVTTAYVTPKKPLPALVDPPAAGAEAQPAASGAKAVFIASYLCSS